MLIQEMTSLRLDSVSTEINNGVLSKNPYQAPQLELYKWLGLTGVSLPIGTNGLDNPLEMNDFLEEKQ